MGVDLAVATTGMLTANDKCAGWGLLPRDAGVKLQFPASPDLRYGLDIVKDCAKAGK